MMRIKVHDEIAHWVCVDCASIQPKPAGDPYPDWACSCGGRNFIRDVLPAVYKMVPGPDGQ